jgi:hypothetical protein
MGEQESLDQSLRLESEDDGGGMESDASTCGGHAIQPDFGDENESEYLEKTVERTMASVMGAGRGGYVSLELVFLL